MKKNIKKIVAIGIGLSIVSGSINPVLAIENQKNNEIVNTQIINDESNSIINGQSSNGKPILTLDQVINAAITNSEDLNLKSQQISMYRKKEDIQDKTNDFYESLGEKYMIFHMTSLSF